MVVLHEPLERIFDCLVKVVVVAAAAVVIVVVVSIWKIEGIRTTKVELGDTSG
jgi:hypothetical protein